MFKRSQSKVLTCFIFVCLCLLMIAGCASQASQAEQKPEQPAETKTLFAYIGANLKDPVTELAESYKQKTGVEVELTFNNSGALLNQVETMKKGDIYMPGGMPFVEQAKQKGHIDQVAGPVAVHTPVIITPKGNPAGIQTVEDLAKNDVKLVLPDKEATALGKTAFKVFDKANLTDKIEKNVIAYLETPAKVVVAITMGQGSAGIVEYSNTFKDREKIEVVEIDESINMLEEIPVASLVYASDKELAKDFIDYVHENGPAVFAKYGFKTKK